ncbi:hypothetical protein CS022_01835 [Veronia nyctiphanis]|uniref:Uncharacterized protein n=1 Tax=Veronia nyctiphanis TaxID=1278244 RepID=A0A4Q0YXB0_9GAMM|nr:hypothetical protein [Veronia nyctiphanis]RXJ74944.1 hypothetical protein CS022_01835 [Veronia nyctiphanis]
MSHFIGWLISVAAIFLSVTLSADWRIFLDTQTFIVILGFVYGIPLAVFGWDKTLKSIVGFKYMFTHPSTKKPELGLVYKAKIKFSFWAVGISFLISLVAIANNIEDLSVLGYALALALLSVVYPMILSGILYYPLYKKLA